MINVFDDILNNHNDEEIIELLYAGMSKVEKVLNDAIKNQNPMAMSSALPYISAYTSILKKVKQRNDLRKTIIEQ